MAKAKADTRDPNAVGLAAKRMTKLTAQRRTDIARQAVTARWAKRKEGTDAAR
jgi:hypothetical protein